ncbi:MAG: hypothetical protein EOM25_13200 [Deltaproteobacteria bacterium]|nr:hypothetical protein [Deltaproteobacteria bacterium]
MSTTIKDFDFATGPISYEEGQVWEECAGCTSLGHFFNRGGVRVPIVGSCGSWDWLTNRWHSDEARNLISIALRSGSLDREGGDPYAMKRLLEEVQKFQSRKEELRGPNLF